MPRLPRSTQAKKAAAAATTKKDKDEASPGLPRKITIQTKSSDKKQLRGRLPLNKVNYKDGSSTEAASSSSEEEEDFAPPVGTQKAAAAGSAKKKTTVAKKKTTIEKAKVVRKKKTAVKKKMTAGFDKSVYQVTVPTQKAAAAASPTPVVAYDPSNDWRVRGAMDY